MADAHHPTLTAQQLRRAVLARQLLLGRARAATTIRQVLGQVAGLQAQYAPTMYIGLWSRLEGFRRADLTDALHDRSVVQGTMLRSTIHLVGAPDYWPINVAIRQSRRRWYLGQRGALTDDAMRAAADRVRAALAVEGALSRTQLTAAAGVGIDSDIGLWIDLVRVPPSGTWERRRADRFAAAQDWIGPEPPISDDDALDHVVRHYLGGFGPASAKEISLFTNLGVGELAASIERVATRRFSAQDGTVLFDVEGLPIPHPGTPAPVRFLGNWEALLLAHARRSLVIREEDRPRIFATTMPQSKPTFLVDGQVAGTWRYVAGTGGAPGRVEIDAWRPLGRVARREVAAEADALVKFHL